MTLPGHLRLHLSIEQNRLLVMALDELQAGLQHLDFKSASIKNSAVADAGWSYANLYSRVETTEAYMLSNLELCHDDRYRNQYGATFDFIRTLCEDYLQVSLLKLDSGRRVGWHTHGDHGRCGYHILQAPIVTNDRCRYLVRKSIDQYSSVETQNYRSGEIWRFSGDHFHDVKNGGTTDRYALQIYVPLNDARFLRHLEASLEARRVHAHQ